MDGAGLHCREFCRKDDGIHKDDGMATHIFVFKASVVRNLQTLSNVRYSDDRGFPNERSSRFMVLSFGMRTPTN